MEEPNWKLINAAIEDIQNWIKEAPNQEVKDYRLGLLLEAIEPKQIMHYYRDDGFLPKIETPMSETYDSAFWHGELDRISKIVENKDAK